MRVWTLLENSTTVIVRRNGLGLSASSFSCLTRNELKWYLERNFQRQLDFAHWFICTCQNNIFLANVVIGDKAYFSMNDTVNTFVMFESTR